MSAPAHHVDSLAHSFSQSDAIYHHIYTAPFRQLHYCLNYIIVSVQRVRRSELLCHLQAREDGVSCNGQRRTGGDGSLQTDQSDGARPKNCH